MKSILFAIALAAALASAAASAANPPPPVTLNESVVISGGYLRLGDLFRNAGDKAAAVIAPAPAPGQIVTLDARWLYRVAQAHGLAWQPYTLADRTVIRRESHVIGREEIEEAIVAALRRHGVTDDFRIALATPSVRLHVPAEKMAAIAVEDIAYDPRSRRFTALVAAPADDPAAQRLRLAGRVLEMIEVPVLKNRVAGDQVIREGDIEWMAVRAEQVPRDALHDAKDLIGKSPKRALRPGAPIRTGDVRRPVLVAKGGLVTMVLKIDNMTLTAKGRAIDDGSDGDTIRVANAQSNLVIDAVVVGANTVTVRPGGRVAMN